MRRVAIAVAALLLVLVSAACVPTASPSPSGIAAQPTASMQSAETTAPISIACSPDTQAPAGLGDPCPEAIVAVELAVAPVRLAIRRVVIEPGPFYCNDVWPGAGSEAACYGPFVRPGQYMHAWVSFNGSDEVAAVMLGRDFPAEQGSPEPSVGPWSATLVTVEVPPDDWVMR